MTPILRHHSDLTGSEVWEGDARQVAAQLEDDVASLAIFDGPYAMNKAEWDRLKVSDLAAWYRPYLEDASRLLGASASLYFWNTAEGWAAVHPLLLSMGWTFRGPIVWHKPNGAAIKNAHEEGARHWPDVTEVCALYQRTCPEASGPFLALAEKMESERQRLGLSRATIDESMKTSNVSQYWWQQREWRCPTEEHWIHLQNLSGGFQWSWHQMKEWENQARSQYNASRPPFDCPLGVGNVWTHPTVAGPKRLRAEDGSTLHPCQKPLLFAERMIRASSRPGDTVWAPFGGTIREAVAAEQIARSNPEEARRVITAELNQDGRDYLGPSIRQLRGLGTRRVDPRQGQLFGGT